VTGSDLIPRNALSVAKELLEGARGVVVNGPRQSGKSELLKLLAASFGGNYVTLDQQSNLKAARTDPSGFLERLGSRFLIDEVQRGGDPLLLAIKQRLDESRARGQCILAGSTRFLFEPRLSESLAGRVRFLELWPLAIGEIQGTPQRFVDAAFANELDQSTPQHLTRQQIAELIVRGGFPEAVTASSARQRSFFLEDYTNTVTQRDIREISAVHHGVELSNVLRLVAARTAEELNVAKFAESANLGSETTRRYLPLLEAVYLHHLLPAWSGNFSARAIRRPKLHMTDTGLCAHLLGISADRFAGNEPILGHLFETFVVNEILKQMPWNETSARAFHWRDRNGTEVDLILERNDGQLVAIECKLANDVDTSDFRGLRRLRDELGDKFIGGMVIHVGDRVRSFGDRLLSVPVAALWSASTAE
jgi:uncharacterized protein